MVTIQRIELRVPAPTHHTDVLSLLQPSGAFSGVKAPSKALTEGMPAVSDTDAPSINDVDGPLATAASTSPDTQDSVQASADTALRSFLSRIHATGMMVDAPTWRLEVQGSQVLQCATFHIRREHADDLLSVFRRCSLFQRLTSFDVINLEDHTHSHVEGTPFSEGSVDAKYAQAKQGVIGQLKLEKLMERVRTNSQLSFDYLTLLVVASCLAGLGLGSNNTVIIIASMLVSPLMGPVLAVTFGVNVHNWRLARLGFFAGSLSMLICAAIGAAIMVTFGAVIRREQYCAGEWPPAEMRSRGNIASMWLNFLFAVASAVGVAVGLVNDNAASMVGTAISASLLPPAVNAGMFWGYIAVHSVYNNPDFLGRPSCPDSCLLDCATIGCPDSPACDAGAQAECLADCPEGCLPWCQENPGFSKTDFFEYGCYSMLLTVVNIAVIVVVGIGMLRAQEYGPQSSTFWKRDIGLARTLRSTSTFRDLGRKLKSTHKPSGGKAAGARQLKRSAGAHSMIDDARLAEVLRSVEAEALDSGGPGAAGAPGAVAGKYMSLLSVAHRRATAQAEAGAEQGAGWEVLDDMYDLFGARKQKKGVRQHQRRQMDELARVGNELHGHEGSAV